jgi:hypothetical protein
MVDKTSPDGTYVHSVQVSDLSPTLPDPAPDAVVAAEPAAVVGVVLETPPAPVEPAPSAPGVPAAGNEDTVFLVGRPPREEFLQVTAGQPAPAVPWADLWQTANAHIQNLAATEGGYTVPETQPLAAELAPLEEALRADPVFQANFPSPPQFRLVELDRLIVFQKVIHLSHVVRLLQQLPAAPTGEDLFEFCFPTQPTVPVQFAQGSNNSVYLISESQDFRVLGSGLFVTQEPLPQIEVTGRHTHSVVAACAFGYGLNLLHALELGGRLVLFNGSHRAYALRSRDVRWAPCVVQPVAPQEVLPTVANTPMLQNLHEFLASPRPPLLRDYFDSQLHVRLRSRPTRRIIRVRVTLEVDPPVGIPG